MKKANHFRSIFISDVHLGSRGCQAKELLKFLKAAEADRYYIVGDLIDGWRLKRKFYWPQSHNDLIQKMLRKVRKGGDIYYMPGNHDEGMRHFIGEQFGKIHFVEEASHESVDGKRYLVIHGDKYDSIVRHYHWLAVLGERAYHVSFFINSFINFIRRNLGLGYWSLNAYLKNKVAKPMICIKTFKEAAVMDAEVRGFDGVICGHLHEPEIDIINGIEYMNSGDWVENCTALVEHQDGRFEVIDWNAKHEAELITVESLPEMRTA